ncbi:MAG: hypothetical protein INQ03_17065 [Candidatus Heimdallarchaeota archaeon]|nr:hypothetical protein [Candidatus Heimdallarchaeota archaeon]
MDHVVYLDKKSKELEKLADKSKTMIIRGAAGRKMPYGRVSEGDVLYLLNNDGSGQIIAKMKVSSVYNSEKMTKEESISLVDNNSKTLNLTTSQNKRWAGKRYLVLIGVEEFENVDPFSIERSDFGNMDDWLPVEDIEKVRK